MAHYGIPDPTNTVEFLAPSIVADGELLDFAVWLVRYFDASNNEFSAGYIINGAAGGFVTGIDPINIYDPFESAFNNQLFTDLSLTSSTNNSLFTPISLDPIATVTGNVFHDETDLQIKGRGLNYLLTRTYNSGPTQADPAGVPMGQKWSHSYAMRLIAKDYGQEPNDTTLASNSDDVVSSITYVNERGGEEIYGVSGTGSIPTWTVINPRGTFDTLDLSQAPTYYTLRFRNGIRYVFGDADLAVKDAVARLLFIRDPDGNELSFTYTGGNLTQIQDNLGIAGRTGLVLTYNVDGRLEQVTDWDTPTARTWKYTYDAGGNLKTAEDPLGLVTTYNYAPNTNLLTEVVRPADRDGNGSGDVRTTFSYYSNNRGFTNANSFGLGEQLDYDLFRKRTRITDPRGFVTAHSYDPNGELTKLTHPDGGVQKFRHNPDGRRWKKVDSLGFATQYSYCLAGTLAGCASDTGGSVTREQDPLLKTTDFTYGTYDQVTEVNDKNGNWRKSILATVTDIPNGLIFGKEKSAQALVNGSASVTSRTRYFADGNVKLRIDYLDPTDSSSQSKRRQMDFFYDAAGLNLERVETRGLPSGELIIREFTYDGLGRVKTQTLQRRTSGTDPTVLFLTTSFDYDKLDRVIRVTDPLGNETETDYDENGLVTEIRVRYKQPDSSFIERVVERRKYDDADRLIEVKDINDEITAFAYDEAGNLIRQTGPTGVSTRFEYDSRNRRTAVIDANGHRSETDYDLNGRVVASIDPNGNKITFDYDAVGRLISRVDALGKQSTFAYDGVGNLTGQVDANANADPGNLGLVNALGDTVTMEYDELGRETKRIDALDGETLFEYDLFGNVTLVTDANLQDTQFITDELGRRIEIIDPVVEMPTDATQTFQYDEAGNVIVATDREGNTVRTTYDGLNRPILREFLTSLDTESLVYDSFGNLASISNSEVTYTFTYDNKNRLLSKTDSRLGRSLGFQYDAADRLIQKTDYQGDVTSFLYDGTGRLVAERNPAYLQVSYHYDAAGRLLDRILSNGAKTSYGYDDGNRLTSLTHVAADGTVVQTTPYTHDAVGNIKTAGGVIYTYDPLHRLTGADLPGGTADDRSYGYDKVGNRETLTTAAGTFDYIYGDGNRLSEIRRASDGSLVNSFLYYGNSGGVAAKLDGAGVQIYGIARNGRGQAISVSGPGFSPSHTFGYDAFGLRVRRDDGAGSHLFHLEGENLEAIYGAGGALEAKYLRGTVIDEVVNGYLFDSSGKPTNFTYHHDPVNSVTALTGHAGTVEETITFAPFGEEIATTGSSANALRFTGRESVPSSGIYYFRARYYDPEIGRFLSEDPLGFAGGINFYAYAENNPINFNDPTGLDTQIQIGFTRVTPGLGPVPQTNHQFTIITDTETGEQFAFRAGPSAQGFLGSAGNSSLSASGGSLSASSGNGGSGGFGFGQIEAIALPFNENFPDFPNMLPTIQNVGVIERDFADSVANAKEFRDATNRSNIAYSPLGSNSNSTNTTFIESLTGVRPESDLLAPGRGVRTPAPGLSFGPSPFVFGSPAGGGFDFPSQSFSAPLVEAFCTKC